MENKTFVHLQKGPRYPDSWGQGLKVVNSTNKLWGFTFSNITWYSHNEVMNFVTSTLTQLLKYCGFQKPLKFKIVLVKNIFQISGYYPRNSKFKLHDFNAIVFCLRMICNKKFHSDFDFKIMEETRSPQNRPVKKQKNKAHFKTQSQPITLDFNTLNWQQMLRTMARKAQKTKEGFETPPALLNTRRRIHKIIADYDHLTSRSTKHVGSDGSKKIIVKWKQ